MTSTDGAPSPPVSGSALVFLGATWLSIVGTSFGLLGATGALVASAGNTAGGLATGVFVAVMLLATAIGTCYGPLLATRVGVRGAFASAQAVNAFVYLVAGIALLAGAPTVPTLLVAAPVMGASIGLIGNARTLASKAYQSSDNTAHSYARLSVAVGFAGGVGGITGGLVLAEVAFGWGLVVNALLSVPLVVFVARVPPSVEPVLPQHPHHPWRRAARDLSTNRQLRWSAALGASSIVFLGPVVALVVPVATGLRQGPAVTAAGLLLASFAAGEMLAPWAVRFAQRRSTDLLAGEVAGALAGAMLLALGVASILVADRVELLAWMLIAVPFGVFRFAAKALYIGSVADAGGDPAANLASANTAVNLLAPVGTLAFGLGLDHGAVHTSLFVSGACALAVNLLVIRALRSSDLATPVTDESDR